jgi:hypothetical protein
MAQVRKPKLSSEVTRLLDGDGYGFAAAYLGGSTEVADEAMLARTYADRLALLVDVANLSATSWFWRVWGRKIRPELEQDLLAIRAELRTIWKNPDLPRSDSIVRQWLNWRPAPIFLEAYKRAGFAPGAPFNCSIKAGKFIPDFLSLRAMLIQGILEHWPHLRFCSNQSCLTPYFVAKRKDQTVCDAEICKAEKQRQHALKWWKENRGKASQSPTEKGRKKSKGVAHHVTRKAR